MKRLIVLHNRVPVGPPVECHAAVVSPSGVLIALDLAGMPLRGWGPTAWSTFEIEDDGPTAAEKALADVIEERDAQAERHAVLVLALGQAVGEGTATLPESVLNLLA